MYKYQKEIKEAKQRIGEIVALTSVSRDRIIYMYRVCYIYKNNQKAKFAWDNRFNNIYEVEKRRYVKPTQITAGTKRLMYQEEIPQKYIEEYEKQEKEMGKEYYKQKKKMIEIAMRDYDEGKEPNLFLKYGEVNYRRIENGMNLPHRIEDSEGVSENIGYPMHNFSGWFTATSIPS